MGYLVAASLIGSANLAPTAIIKSGSYLCSFSILSLKLLEVFGFSSFILTSKSSSALFKADSTLLLYDSLFKFSVSNNTPIVFLTYESSSVSSSLFLLLLFDLSFSAEVGKLLDSLCFDLALSILELFLFTLSNPKSKLHIANIKIVKTTTKQAINILFIFTKFTP